MCFVIVIYVATSGLLDDVEVSDIQSFEQKFISFVDKRYPDIFHEIHKRKVLSDELKAKLDRAGAEFKKEFTSGHTA